uniref:Uncharacterized protein n=1 Tax=Oryza barthii TaxID=65489 RepID=A0A0D3HRE3_9ORYZ
MAIRSAAGRSNGEVMKLPTHPPSPSGINSDGGDPEQPLARCHTRPPLAAANTDAPQPCSPTTADAPRSPLARPFSPPVPRAVARPPPPRLPAAPPASGREPLPLPIRGKENGDCEENCCLDC